MERVIRVASLHDAGEADRADRRAASPQDRFDAVEELRRVYFGYDEHSPYWQEFLNALRSENVKFLLIGGHALAFHVEARLTARGR